MRRSLSYYIAAAKEKGVARPESRYANGETGATEINFLGCLIPLCAVSESSQGDYHNLPTANGFLRENITKAPPSVQNH